MTSNSKLGWISYWQPHGDSELGTAIVASPNTFIDSETVHSEIPDLSNAYANLKIKDTSVTYYTGFTWKVASTFKSPKEWEHYLNLFAKNLKSPLSIERME